MWKTVTRKSRLLPSIFSTLAVGLAFSVTSFAQEGVNYEDEIYELDTFVVSGMKESLISAQKLKLEKFEIVDSIVASDIGKLPDLSVSEALQRITGIQIERDRGEGSDVMIRGLDEKLTTINGREVFTAGGGRGLSMQDFPAELVAALNVYKSPSADQIEGGVGGAIDIRTRRPFDFDGLVGSATVRYAYNDLVEKGALQYSALLSNRWDTDLGMFGAMVSVAKQTRKYRLDWRSNGSPSPRTNVFEGKTIYVPGGSYDIMTIGERDRTGINVALEWSPRDELNFYFETAYSKFETDEAQYGMYIGAPSYIDPDSVEFYENSNNAVSYYEGDGSTIWAGHQLRPTENLNQQYSFGGTWTVDRFKVTGDISYTRADRSFVSNYFTMANNGLLQGIVHDTRHDVPTFLVTGSDLTDPNTYKFGYLQYTEDNFNGDMVAAKVDVEYSIEDGFFNSIKAGVRYADRGADNETGRISGYNGIPSSFTVADHPDYYEHFPVDNYMPSVNNPMIGDYLIVNLDKVKNGYSDWDQFGLNNVLSPPDPLSTWNITEKTNTAYLMSTFSGDRFPIEGNIGVRFVQTKESVDGYQNNPETGVKSPINVDNDYNDLLPMMNIRYRLPWDQTFVRVSASKMITRPDFSNLSPSITLIVNHADQAQNSGASGNPFLDPVESTNLDVSFEKYFNESTSVSVAYFYKDVDGFIATAQDWETHDGVDYLVSRPQNSAPATIKGFELGYQQFFDFLPGWMSGLGVQTNYTYVESETESQIVGLDVPLQGLSQNSYNLVGMYEKDKLSVRLAYNWRSKYFAGTVNVSGMGVLPIYRKGYGTLDASISYDITDRLTATLAGSNLLDAMVNSYYGDQIWKHENRYDGMQVIFTMSVDLF